MNMPPKEVEEQASSLSAEEQAERNEAMRKSLASEFADIEKAWILEIERRAAAHERGEMPAIVSSRSIGGRQRNSGIQKSND